jgi:hypothetical protein
MLELLWQSIVLSFVVYGFTALILVLVDIQLAGAKGKASVVRKLGMERRKDNVWLSQVILPALPPLLGFIIAGTVPMRPDLVVSYVTSQPDIGEWARVIYGFWGVVCGMGSSWAYDKVRDIIKGFNIGSGGGNGNEG